MNLKSVAGPWRKSSRSGGTSGNCVEARLIGTPQLSDSKLAEDRPVLDLDSATYDGFITAVKTGRFDLR